MLLSFTLIQSTSNVENNFVKGCKKIYNSKIFCDSVKTGQAFPTVCEVGF